MGREAVLARPRAGDYEAGEQLTTLFLKYKPIPVVPGFGWRAYADLEEHLQKPWVVKTIPMEDKEQKSSEEST